MAKWDRIAKACTCIMLAALLLGFAGCSGELGGSEGSAESSASSHSANPPESANSQASEEAKAAEAEKAREEAEAQAAKEAEEAEAQKAREEAEALARKQAELQQRLEAAELTANTGVLEYSNKDVDPLSLVKCDDGDVKVTTDGAIDLSAVGVQNVAFELAIEDQTATRSIEFEVRDTKAPKIKFDQEAITIEQGDEYDPQKNVKSVEDPVDGALNQVAEEPNWDEANIEAGKERVFDAGWFVVEGSVDASTPGTYAITAKAADIHGNVATNEFKVVVKEPEEPIGAAVVEGAPNEAAGATATGSAEQALHDYVLNVNTMKFHHRTCRAVSQMKEENRRDVEMTREEVLAQGYEPCGICNP